MPIFAVTYGYSTDSDARDRLRPEHRAFLAEQDGLLLSGPTSDGGALLLFEGKSADDVEEVLDQDPFYVEGLVTERGIVEWTTASGPWRELLGLD